jgi:hypothetical protein
VIAISVLKVLGLLNLVQPGLYRYRTDLLVILLIDCVKHCCLSDISEILCVLFYSPTPYFNYLSHLFIIDILIKMLTAKLSEILVFKV